MGPNSTTITGPLPSFVSAAQSNKFLKLFGVSSEINYL